MKMFSLVPRSLRKTFSQVFHFTCNLPGEIFRGIFRLERVNRTDLHHSMRASFRNFPPPWPDAQLPMSETTALRAVAKASVKL